MSFFLSQLPQIWPWLILIAAQTAGLCGHLPLALVLLTAFGAVVTVLGMLTLPASLAIGLGLAGAASVAHLSGRASLIGQAVLIVWCLVLGAHLLPGVRNLPVLDHVRAGPDSLPFTLYLNIDKPMVFFAMLLACPGILRRDTAILSLPLIAGLALLPVLFVVALALGAVRPEFGLPDWWLVFALSNLFLTCLAEEAFFRGYLQPSLIGKFGAPVGIALASLLFGLAHFGGGLPLIGFASVLGLACGLGYWATGRLWVSIAMHFGFNFAHLALFTYPGPL